MTSHNFTTVHEARRHLCTLFPLPKKHLLQYYGVRATIDFLANPYPVARFTSENPYNKGFLDGFNDVKSLSLTYLETLSRMYVQTGLNAFEEEHVRIDYEMTRPFNLRVEYGDKRLLLRQETEALDHFVKAMNLGVQMKNVKDTVSVAYDFVRVKQFDNVIGNGFDESVYQYANLKGRMQGERISRMVFEEIGLQHPNFLLPAPNMTLSGLPGFQVTRPITMDFKAPYGEPPKSTRSNIKQEPLDYDDSVFGLPHFYSNVPSSSNTFDFASPNTFDFPPTLTVSTASCTPLSHSASIGSSVNWNAIPATMWSFGYQSSIPTPFKFWRPWE